MNEFLSHPAVQSSVVPFTAGLIAAVALYKVRLGGLAAAAGFLAAVFVIGNFAFEPLTATRKIVLVGALAPLLGVVADLAFKPTRATGIVLGILFGAASLWVFWSVLSQRNLQEALILGGGIFAFVALVVGFTVSLHADPVRAGAAGLASGLGSGVAAVLGASALLGQYGMALGAACGSFLLLVMIVGRGVQGGATLTLSASVTSSLVAAGAILLAKLSWLSLIALALVPLLVRLPLPARMPVWAQGVVASLYAFAAAVAACGIAWYTSRGASA